MKAELGSAFCLSAGRILGGSSVLSSMIHARGNRRDYDAWPRDGEWSYQAALEYFLRSEDAAAPGLEKRFHASGGPWSVTSAPFRTPLADAFVRAGREIGEHSPLDYNGPVQTGFAFVQASLRNGTRVSAANAYLRSAPRNLQVSRTFTSLTYIFLNITKNHAVQSKYKECDLDNFNIPIYTRTYY